MYLKAHSQVWDNLWQLKAFKNDEKYFFFHLKSLDFFLEIIKFFFIFGLVEKRLDLKDKVSFKICEITIWEINNCNTYIDQYLKEKTQSGNEFGPVKRIQHEKHFPWKIIKKMWWRNYF